MFRTALIAPVLALTIGCVNGNIDSESIYDGEAPVVDDGTDDGVVDPGTDEPTVEAVANCEDFVTSPHNACDGHEDFTLDLISSAVLDDGSTELIVSLHSSAEWMNYPGVLIDGQDLNWWYGIFADDSYEMTHIAPAGTVEVVFTAGALNCQNNDFEGWNCPLPGALVVNLTAQ